MPIPIKPINDKGDVKNLFIDYSFLLQQPIKRKMVTASDKDASLLFELWSKGDRQESFDIVKVNSSIKINLQDLMRLKSMGFVIGYGDKIKFTKKGKLVITTMSLGEGSNFEKEKQEKKYTEILAEMSKRGKKGYRIPKFAVNNSNNLKLS